jgi:hypothetical protein
MKKIKFYFISQICEISEFGLLLDSFLKIKWQINVYCPSITHQDEYFAKTPLELDENLKSSNILTSSPFLTPFMSKIIIVT